jgi:hypothetical protein
MRRMLLVGAVLGFASIASADDKIIVKDSNKTVIVNGSVIVNGNNNIVIIGNNNTVNVNSKTPTSKATLKTPVKSLRPCDIEAMRHEQQVAAWMKMMKR